MCILFDGENISFDVSLVIYINSTNILPIIIIFGYMKLKSSVAVLCVLPGRAKELSAPLYNIVSQSEEWNEHVYIAVFCHWWSQKVYCR
jgi:hypothetical protein